MMQIQADGTKATDRQLQDAVAAYRAGKLGPAEALCRGILKRQPDHVASLQVLAAVAGQSGVPRRGIELLQKVIRLQPGHADGHIQLAKLLRLEGKISEAIVELNTAIDLEPGSAAAYNDLGLIHLAGIDVAKALKCLTGPSSSARLSDRPLQPRHRPRAAGPLGRGGSGLPACRVAITPGFAEAWAKLGNLCLFNGNSCRRASPAFATPQQRIQALA